MVGWLVEGFLVGSSVGTSVEDVGGVVTAVG